MDNVGAELIVDVEVGKFEFGWRIIEDETVFGTESPIFGICRGSVEITACTGCIG